MKMKKEKLNIDELKLIELFPKETIDIDGGGFAYDVGFAIGAYCHYYFKGQNALYTGVYIAKNYKPVH
jgi:hypothetical protein